LGYTLGYNGIVILWFYTLTKFWGGEGYGLLRSSIEVFCTCRWFDWIGTLLSY
jgi:hypothetical protein